MGSQFFHESIFLSSGRFPNTRFCKWKSSKLMNVNIIAKESERYIENFVSLINTEIQYGQARYGWSTT